MGRANAATRGSTEALLLHEHLLHSFTSCKSFLKKTSCKHERKSLLSFDEPFSVVDKGREDLIGRLHRTNNSYGTDCVAGMLEFSAAADQGREKRRVQ
jgi:hypothetical protein